MCFSAKPILLYITVSDLTAKYIFTQNRIDARKCNLLLENTFRLYCNKWKEPARENLPVNPILIQVSKTQIRRIFNQHILNHQTKCRHHHNHFNSLIHTLYTIVFVTQFTVKNIGESLMKTLRFLKNGHLEAKIWYINRNCMLSIRIAPQKSYVEQSIWNCTFVCNQRISGRIHCSEFIPPQTQTESNFAPNFI